MTRTLVKKIYKTGSAAVRFFYRSDTTKFLNVHSKTFLKYLRWAKPKKGLVQNPTCVALDYYSTHTYFASLLNVIYFELSCLWWSTAAMAWKACIRSCIMYVHMDNELSINNITRRWRSSQTLRYIILSTAVNQNWIENEWIRLSSICSILFP